MPSHLPLRQLAFIVEDEESIEFQLRLRGSQLRRADPVPMLLDLMQESTDLQAHRHPLSTILTELYINALDHGILQLDSDLKQGADGFAAYFRQREQRLQSLTEGDIRIGLRIHRLLHGGCVVIEVEDSGKGFDSEHTLACVASASHYSGRGIMLVRSLCKSLQYRSPGNQAEAVYIWD